MFCTGAALAWLVPDGALAEVGGVAVFFSAALLALASRMGAASARSLACWVRTASSSFMAAAAPCRNQKGPHRTLPAPPGKIVLGCVCAHVACTQSEANGSWPHVRSRPTYLVRIHCPIVLRCRSAAFVVDGENLLGQRLSRSI